MTTPSTLVRCPGCTAAVPAATFCAVCGSSLALVAAPPPTSRDVWAPASHAVGTQASPLPVAWPAPRQVPPPTAPVSAVRRRTGRWLVPGLALAVATVATAAAEDTHTITGTLTLAQISDLDAQPGDFCTGEDGYADVGAGTEVRVEDETGVLLASSSLRTGASDGLWCRFDFTLEDVADAAQYDVRIGDELRGGNATSYDDLLVDGWHLDLSLGL